MRRPRAIAAGLGLALASCGPAGDADRRVSLEPVAIDDQEGAVCGMLVRDQSAPRAQAIHADGERSFLCSIGDLLSYLDVPSPHGDPLEVLVEVMQPEEDPLESHPDPHPWLSAAAAVFVVGIPRRQVMGDPVLVYRDVETAEQVMAEYRTAGAAVRVLDFEGLRRWWAARNERSKNAMEEAR